MKRKKRVHLILKYMLLCNIFDFKKVYRGPFPRFYTFFKNHIMFTPKTSCPIMTSYIQPRKLYFQIGYVFVLQVEYSFP